MLEAEQERDPQRRFFVDTVNSVWRSFRHRRIAARFLPTSFGYSRCANDFESLAAINRADTDKPAKMSEAVGSESAERAANV
jgi:hypothetical protein